MAPGSPARSSMRSQTFCCDDLSVQLTNDCPKHGIECQDNVVAVYGPQQKLALRIPGPVGGGFYLISYCPWCGTRWEHRQ